MYWLEILKGKLLVRPRRRWESSITMGVRETVCESVDWIHLVRQRDQWRALVNAIVNLRVP